MNLLKTLATVSSMTMLSRVLGFVRDVLIARMLGASMASDAFFVAFRLPNLLRRIFAEGAFSQAFVPILAEYKTQHGEQASRTFIAYISGLLTLTLALTSLLGVLVAPWLVWLSAPGFVQDAEKFALTTLLLRWMFPYILLISLSSMAGSILNTWNRFAVPAFAPCLLNLSLIGGALFISPHVEPPVLALGFAVLLGGVLQLVWQLPYLKRIGMLVLPRLNFRDNAVWRMLRQMGKAILGVSVSQISLIINTVLASFLTAGSVSWLYYADRLMELPSGVLGVALSTILLPSLAKVYANADTLAYSRLLDWGLRLCFLLALPCALALVLLAEPLTVALFQYGKFSVTDALMTQQALMAYALGLLALMVIKILAPGFYARQNIKTPVRIALISLLATQSFNLLLVWGLGLAHVGLALSISLAACLNAGLLFWQLRRRNLYQPQSGWWSFLGKLTVALVLMSAALLGLLALLPPWTEGAMTERLVRLTLLVAGGALAYFGSLALLGFRPKHFSPKVIR